MSVVTKQYVDTLHPIYREILAAFPKLEPARKAGYGLMYPTLFGELGDRYSPGEIIEACREMERGGAVEVQEHGFVRPTELGEEIITALTGAEAARVSVPPFTPPPA